MNSIEKMRARLVSAVCLGLIIGPGSMATAHGEELPEFTGEDYVVTASRIPTRLSETPANVTVITAEMIAQNHYQDLAEGIMWVYDHNRNNCIGELACSSVSEKFSEKKIAHEFIRIYENGKVGENEKKR